MLNSTIGIARRGFVASLACMAVGAVALAQDTVPIPAPPPTAVTPAQNTDAVPPTASAATLTAQLTQAQLEQLVAPIALYPDPLLAQILMAATYPLEVVEAARWVSAPANRTLTGGALSNALQAQNWDPSIKALVPFPRVLANMSNQLQWTQDLSNAFLAQQADVMAAVQALRHEAMAAQSLKQHGFIAVAYACRRADCDREFSGAMLAMVNMRNRDRRAGFIGFDQGAHVKPGHASAD